MPILESRGSGSAFGFGFGSNTLPDLPASLKTANLIGWYDGADLGTMTFTNGKVSTWRNKRNPGTRDLTQATEANMPTLFQGAFGDRPALLFSGADQAVLRHAGATGLSTGFTVAVVAKKHTNPMNGYYPRVVSFSPNQTGGSPGNYDYDSPGGMIISGFPSNNGLGSWHNANNRGTNIDWNSQVLAVSRHSNALGYGNFLINNTSITTDIGLTETGANRTFSMSSFTGGMTVGGNNHGGGENFAGFVGEVIIWDTYLSDADLATLASYVNAKWKMPPAFRTTVLNDYIAGSAYSQQISAIQPTGGAITYALTSGSLPTGLSLSSSGLISGTVTGGTSGTFSFTVRATDSDGESSFQSYSLADVLYAFTAHTFTTAGTTGRTGPSITTVRSSYSSSPWASTYLNAGAYNGYQHWTVPKTGTYRITAAGASGNGTYGSRPGGGGAIVRGDVSLTKGEVIGIVCGQIGIGSTQTSGNSGSAGGGGSFVWRTSNNELLMAGGGGGGAAGNWSNGGANGVNASYTTSGTAGSPGNAGGSGGGAGQYGGGRASGSGAGWTGSGSPTNTSNPGGGLTFSAGFTGGNNYNGTLWSSDGGFGGGGGGYDTAGGGGGGYSGGGSGKSDSQGAGGGGGGSFKSGTNQTDVGLNGGNFIGNGTGNSGYVVIERVA